jgi:hypothetical protein
MREIQKTLFHYSKKPFFVKDLSLYSFPSELIKTNGYRPW